MMSLCRCFPRKGVERACQGRVWWRGIWRLVGGRRRMRRRCSVRNRRLRMIMGRRHQGWRRDYSYHRLLSSSVEDVPTLLTSFTSFLVLDSSRSDTHHHHHYHRISCAQFSGHYIYPSIYFLLFFSAKATGAQFRSKSSVWQGLISSFRFSFGQQKQCARSFTLAFILLWSLNLLGGVTGWCHMGLGNLKNGISVF
jgi:hypothetical protein